MNNLLLAGLQSEKRFSRAEEIIQIVLISAGRLPQRTRFWNTKIFNEIRGCWFLCNFE